MKKLKWGILGAANIALNHVIPALQSASRCEVAGIASRDLDKARAAADRLGIEKAYGSYDDMLADDGIEAVYNPLPNALHVPMTIKALAAGKHVLCEKPIALTAEEAEQLREAAAHSGCVAGEAFMVRHHPQWNRAREIIRSGRIGTVRAMQVFFSYFLDDPANIRNRAGIGGGGLYDVGCYALNTARFIFGTEPQRAIGLFDMDPEFGTDRIASGLVAFEDGGQLTFTCGTQLSLFQAVSIVGTKGRIQIAIPFNAPADEVTTITVDDGRDLSGGGAETIRIGACDQYRLQGEAFARTVLDGEPFACGLEDAAANMRAIDALFRSANSLRWEKV